MALPNSNISVAMVKAELGAATNDVGQLCIHPNINKWSKWKPVRFNKVSGLTLADLQSVNFGFLIPTDSNNDYTILLQPWEYLKPRGGAQNEFYRLDDFRNYNHNSVKLMAVPEILSLNAINSSTNFNITADKTQSSTTVLSIDDFSDNSIGNLYFCVVLKTPNNLAFIKTASGQVKTGDLTVVLPASAAPFNYSPLQMIFGFSSEKIDEVVSVDSLGLTVLKSIPADNRYYMVDVIRNMKDLLTVRFDYISRNATPVSNFEDINQYLQSTIPQKWFSTPMGNGFFKVNIKNNSSSNFTVAKNKIRISVTKRVDGSAGTYSIEPEMYNSSGAAITSIGVPANGSVDVIIGRSGLFVEDILPMPGDKSDTQVRLVYQYTSQYLEWVLSPSILIQA
jgi:hypothetical protein